jgi:hypothetical protein
LRFRASLRGCPRGPYEPHLMGVFAEQYWLYFTPAGARGRGFHAVEVRRKGPRVCVEIRGLNEEWARVTLTERGARALADMLLIRSERRRARAAASEHLPAEIRVSPVPPGSGVMLEVVDEQRQGQPAVVPLTGNEARRLAGVLLVFSGEWELDGV